MKDTIKMVAVLTIISGIAGGLLALTNAITRKPIELSLHAEQLEAMRKVLPDYDNDPSKCVCIIEEENTVWKFYVARKAGVFVGAAFEAASDQGYSGLIRILAGVLADNTLKGIEIIQQTETPGLGAKITAASFKNQFAGKSIAGTSWAVKKDGGDIDAITGATISPRAVVSALQKGLNTFAKHRETIAHTNPK